MDPALTRTRGLAGIYPPPCMWTQISKETGNADSQQRTTYLQASQLRRKRVTPFFAGVSYRQLGRSVGRAILARAGVLERACVRRAERSACEAGHGDSRHLAARSFRLSTVASWTKIVVT